MHLGGALDDYLDWIYGPHDKHVGDNCISEKAFWARKRLHDYVWSGGGTRPPWSY